VSLGNTSARLAHASIMYVSTIDIFFYLFDIFNRVIFQFLYFIDFLVLKICFILFLDLFC